MLDNVLYLYDKLTVDKQSQHKVAVLCTTRSHFGGIVTLSLTYRGHFSEIYFFSSKLLVNTVILYYYLFIV